MTAKIDGTAGLLQQYDYQVSTTGFSYTFAAGTTVLVMNPAGTLATGTITMPAAPADGMTISFSSTQTITALTVAGNTGQSIVGNPTTLNAGGAVTLVYRLSNTTWYTQVNTASASRGPVTTIYTSPGTWGAASGNLKSVKVTVIAGGGGAGGTGANATSGAGGGAGGGYGFFPTPGNPALASPVAVTVGSAGAGAPQPAATGVSAGNPGGTSSFGALLSATGGGGGLAPSGTSGAGGAFTNSPTNFGGPGTPGNIISIYSTTNPTTQAYGGSSWGNYGVGGAGSGPFSSPTTGNPGTGYGSGGGAIQTVNPGIKGTGGSGTGGFVIVEEFY